MCHSKGPHFNLRMGGGGPKEFFGSEILAKRDFFGSMKDTCTGFLLVVKKHWDLGGGKLTIY